jgi:hypothetical protein
MRPTHARWPGEDGQGVVRLAVALRREGRGLEGFRGSSLRTTAPQGRRSGPVTGGMAWGCRGTNSIAHRSTLC